MIKLTHLNGTVKILFQKPGELGKTIKNLPKIN
jgi:hypothetical protein